MEGLILFSVIIAGVFGTVFTIIFGLTLYWDATYTELQKSIDTVLNGGSYTFHPHRPFVVAVICWSWFFAFYGQV